MQSLLFLVLNSGMLYLCLLPDCCRMFFLKNTFSALLVVLFFVSCTKEKGLELSSYYYPLDELSGSGKVYCYESSLEKQDPPFYWHYQSFKEGGKTFLKGTYYDYLFRPFQYVQEEALYNGMKLVDFKLYEYDSLGQQREIKVNIEGGNVFPFLLKDSLAVLYTKLSWKSPLDTSYTTTLIRNRQYAGDTTWLWEGQTHQAVNFYVRELIDVESEGHIEKEYGGAETYLKGKGLVAFQKNISSDFRIAYKLSRILSYEEFLEMQKR